VKNPKEKKSWREENFIITMVITNGLLWCVKVLGFKILMIPFHVRRDLLFIQVISKRIRLGSIAQFEYLSFLS